METEIEINFDLEEDEVKRKPDILSLEQKAKITKIEDDDSNSRKKPGRKRLELSESKSKKEKNRVAQRAWRERKEKYVLELEAKISELEKAKNKTETEKQQLQLIVEKLKSENIYLKSTSFIFTPTDETKKLISQSKLNIQNQITNNTFNNTFRNSNNSVTIPNDNPENFRTNSLLHSINTNSEIHNSLNQKNILNNSILNNTTSLQTENVYSKSNMDETNSFNHQEPTPPMNTNDFGLELISDNNAMFDELFNSINYNINPTLASSLNTSTLEDSFMRKNSNHTIGNNGIDTQQINKNEKSDLINNLYMSLMKQNIKQEPFAEIQPHSFATNQNLNNLNNMFIVNNKLTTTNNNNIFNSQISPNINSENLLLNNSLNTTTAATLPFMNTSFDTSNSSDKLTNEIATTTENNTNLELLMNNTNASFNFASILPKASTTTTTTTNSLTSNISSATQNDFSNYKSLSNTGEFNNDFAIQLSKQPLDASLLTDATLLSLAKQQPLDTSLLSLTNDVSNIFQNIPDIQGFTDMTTTTSTSTTENQNIFNGTTTNDNAFSFTNPSFSMYRDNTTTTSSYNHNPLANSGLGIDQQQENIQLISDDLFNSMIQQMHKQNEEENYTEEDDEFDNIMNINELVPTKSTLKNNNDNAYLNTPITPELSLKEGSSEIDEYKQQQQQAQEEVATPQSISNDIKPVSSSLNEEEKMNHGKELQESTKYENKQETATNNNDNRNKKTSISTLQFPAKQEPTKLNIPYAVFPKVSQDTVDNFINDAKLTDEELDCLCLELKKKATCKEKLKYIQTNMSIEGWSIEKWEKGRMKKKVTTSS